MVSLRIVMLLIWVLILDSYPSYLKQSFVVKLYNTLTFDLGPTVLRHWHSSDLALFPYGRVLNDYILLPSNHSFSQPYNTTSHQPINATSTQPSIQSTIQRSFQPSIFTNITLTQPTAQVSNSTALLSSVPPSVQPTSPSQNQTTTFTHPPIIQPSNLSFEPIGQLFSQSFVEPFNLPSFQPSNQPSSPPFDQLSTAPSNQPSSQPSNQPTSQPSSPPSSQPTSQPLRSPSSQPSNQPSSPPSKQPTDQPSCPPSIQPSNQPTSQPSNQPSSPPSSQLSHQPTSLQSNQPSSPPSCKPSSPQSDHPSSTIFSSSTSAHPTVQSTVLPFSTLLPSAPIITQPTSQPSGQPTDQPTKQPSVKPSVQASVHPSTQSTGRPSSQPSRQPSSQPSCQPSNAPSDQPSTQPTLVPTIMPSPFGRLGQQWWYLISAHSDVIAENFNNYKQRDIISGLNYAFDQLIIDTTTDKLLSQSITVVVNKLNIDDDRDDFYDHSNARFDTLVEKVTSVENTKMSFRVRIWCSSHKSLVSSINVLHQVEAGSSSDSLLSLLRKKDLYGVTDVILRDVEVSTITTPAPKDPDDLPPVRITWIIMGTLLVFLALLIFIYYLKNFNLIMYDLDLDCLIDSLSSCGQCISRCVSMPFNWQAGYRRSFHLTPAHDIDNDMTSRDVELNIHYSGKTIERRKSEYLLDEDHVEVPKRPRSASIRRSSFDSNSSSGKGAVAMVTPISRHNSYDDSSGSESGTSYDQDGSPLLSRWLNRSTTTSAFSPLPLQSGHSLTVIDEHSNIDGEGSPDSNFSTAYNPLSVDRSIDQKGYSKAWSDMSSSPSLPFSPTSDTREDMS